MSDNERIGRSPRGPQDTSEVKPKITSETKEKNPGRVAAGKKLAAMNRARMSRTVNRYDATEPTQHEQTVGQRQSQVDDRDTTDWSSPMVLLTVIGVVSGLGCLYYTYKQDKRLETSPISQIERSSQGSKISTRDVSQTLEEPQSGKALGTRGSQSSSSSGGGNLKSFD